MICPQSLFGTERARAVCARRRVAVDHNDVAEFTKGVLLFWQNYGSALPTWAKAMQIVGSFTPNSAAAERVFSLLKLMFGELQMRALSDLIQAALMLKYNEREVG